MVWWLLSVHYVKQWTMNIRKLKIFVNEITMENGFYNLLARIIFHSILIHGHHEAISIEFLTTKLAKLHFIEKND